MINSNTFLHQTEDEIHTSHSHLQLFLQRALDRTASAIKPNPVDIIEENIVMQLCEPDHHSSVTQCFRPMPDNFDC